MLKLDLHVGRKNYPEGFVLDDGVPEGARSWVRGVVVGGVGDHVDLATFAAHCGLAEPNGAVGQALAVVGPVGVAFPAVIYWVAGQALGLVVDRCGE